jgi:hypothetical protein
MFFVASPTFCFFAGLPASSSFCFFADGGGGVVSFGGQPQPCFFGFFLKNVIFMFFCTFCFAPELTSSCSDSLWLLLPGGGAWGGLLDMAYLVSILWLTWSLSCPSPLVWQWRQSPPPQKNSSPQQTGSQECDTICSSVGVRWRQQRRQKMAAALCNGRDNLFFAWDRWRRQWRQRQQWLQWQWIGRWQGRWKQRQIMAATPSPSPVCALSNFWKTLSNFLEEHYLRTILAAHSNICATEPVCLYCIFGQISLGWERMSLGPSRMDQNWPS